MGKKILVVDDSRTVRQQVGFTLSKEGYDIIEAEDGRDGINKLQANPDTSMIVSDVNMPNMGGLEMVEAIRQIPQFKYVPIIILTTESSGDKVNRAKSAGSSGWLLKPFNPDQLLGAIRKLCR